MEIQQGDWLLHFFFFFFFFFFLSLPPRFRPTFAWPSKKTYSWSKSQSLAPFSPSPPSLLLLFVLNGNSAKYLQVFPPHISSLFLIFSPDSFPTHTGTAHGYFSIDLSSEQTTTLHTFSPPLSTSSASFSPFSLSSLVGGGGGGGRVGLVVKTYDDRVVTTVGGGKILFFDFVGENLPPPLCREEGEAGGEVIGMAVRHPYLLCMYRDGVVVFNILERRQIQVGVLLLILSLLCATLSYKNNPNQKSTENPFARSLCHQVGLLPLPLPFFLSALTFCFQWVIKCFCRDHGLFTVFFPLFFPLLFYFHSSTCLDCVPSKTFA